MSFFDSSLRTGRLCMGISLILAGLLSVGCDSFSSQDQQAEPPELVAPTDAPVTALVKSGGSVDTMRATDFWTYKSENVHTITYTEEGEQVTVRPEVTLLNLGAEGASSTDRVVLRLPGFIPEKGTYKAGLPGVDERGRPALTFDATYRPAPCSQHQYDIGSPFEEEPGTLVVEQASPDRLVGKFDVTLARSRVGVGGECEGAAQSSGLDSDSVRVVGHFSVAPDSVLGD